MKIKDIKHIETNETRTDGKYPLRIGSTVEFLYEPIVGMGMNLFYILDNQGNPKSGCIRTSMVDNIVETDTEIVIVTKNSIYCLEKE